MVMWSSVCAVFLFSTFLELEGQRLVYLNTTQCADASNVSCYANNVDGFYVAVDMSVSTESTSGGSVPGFELGPHDLIEIEWRLPSFPLRYLGVATYLNLLSDGTQVFAEVANPLNFVEMAEQCKLASVDLLWNSVIRLLFSTNSKMLEGKSLVQQDEQGSILCTFAIPVPGSPFTNLTQSDYCEKQHEKKGQKGLEGQAGQEGQEGQANASQFSLVFRLTLPSNNSALQHYLGNIGQMAKVSLLPAAEKEKSFNQYYCNPPLFGYPKLLSRPLAQDEMSSKSTVALFRWLLERVTQSIFENYPEADVQNVDQTYPWMNKINYTDEGGFACINTSSNCQGATADSTYMRSKFYTSSSDSFFLVIGCVHHDFVPSSHYSSMSLYELATQDLNSGVGILSIVDQEQRSSALGFVNESLGNKINFSRIHKLSLSPLNRIWDHGLHGSRAGRSLFKDSDNANLNSMYVSQFGYSCLTKLPDSTLCKTFNEKTIPIGSNVFFLGRTYASPGPDPSSLIPEVVLHVKVDQ